MSADTTDSDGEEQTETIDKTKRVVLYPDNRLTPNSFMESVQDKYDPWEQETRKRTTTTYMMEVGGDSCDLTESQWETWKDNEVEGVRVWEKEGTSITRKPAHTTSFIARHWIASEMGDVEFGDVHKKGKRTHWKYNGDVVLSVFCTPKKVKMVKKLPEQSPDDIFEEDSEERMALIFRFKPDGFPAEHEKELNQFIGSFFADIMKEYPVDEVRPVNCFEVEEKKTVCPRV